MNASIDGETIRGDLVTLEGAARLLDLDPRALSVYRNRDKAGRTRNPFPEPVAKVGRSELFRKADVLAWDGRRARRSSP